MNAFELLKKDHRQVSRIMEQLETAVREKGSKREELFGRVRDMLRVHSDIEERIFYKALKDIPETRDIILESIEEHKLVDQLLEELDSSTMEDVHWPARLAVLRENVEHHVQEEEGELFSKARRILGEQRIEDLGKRLEEEKKHLTETA